MRINDYVYLPQGRGEDGNQFYMNSKTGGMELYRPLSKMNSKETEDTIVTTIKRVQAEMEDMEDTVISYHGKKIFHKHKLLITMLNGKCR